MKHKSYKHIITLFALCFLGNTFAQKFDKKFTESFKVNKDVEVVINASNTEINVTNWNKNEVKVEAFIEVEGLSKEDAEKYFKNWNFEALGNKSKVKITSKGGNSFHFKNDFVFFNDNDFTFPDIEIHDIQLPDIETIVIPEMDFDFDFDYENIFEDLEDLDENVGKDGNYSFQLHDGKNKVVIKSKKDWIAFKKTKKYKELKEKLKIDKIKMRKDFAISKKKMKKQLEKAKLEIKKIDKEKLKKELANAKKHIMEMKMNYNSSSNDIIINGKKIKIKKRLEIKVPNKATFNLNTRHCKVKLPNTVASGNVKYGGFNADYLNGGKLKIDYSNVSIDNLNGCTIFLNNVTDAKIASVTNTKMSNNSSGVKIITINENVDMKNKFGELSIKEINPNYQSFKLLLDYTEAFVNTTGVKKDFIINIDEKSPLFPNKASLKFDILNPNKKDINGNYIIKTKDGTFIIEGKYSQISLKE